MLKYLLILTLITLSACTQQAEDIAYDEERNKYTIYNIL
jgi:hypothetical protein